MKENENSLIKAIMNGEEIRERCGRKVRVLCTDANNDYPIVALETDNKGKEQVMCYTKHGISDIAAKSGSDTTPFDLIPASQLRKGYINLMKSPSGHIQPFGFYTSKEEAYEDALSEPGKTIDGYIACAYVEW